MHDPDDGARVPCISHGARAVFACSKKGVLLQRGARVWPGQAEV